MTVIDEPRASVRIDLGGGQDELIAPDAPGPGSGSRIVPLVVVTIGIAFLLGLLFWLNGIDSPNDQAASPAVSSTTTAVPTDAELAESALGPVPLRGSDSAVVTSSPETQAQMPRLLDEHPSLSYLASDDEGRRILGVDQSMMIHYSSNGVTWRARKVAHLPDGRPVGLDFVDGFFVLSVNELDDPAASVADSTPYRITFWVSGDGGFRWSPYGELTPLGPAAIEGTGNLMDVEFTPDAALVYVSDRPDEPRLFTKEGTALLPPDAEICGLTTAAIDPVEYFLSSCVDGVDPIGFVLGDLSIPFDQLEDPIPCIQSVVGREQGATFADHFDFETRQRTRLEPALSRRLTLDGTDLFEYKHNDYSPCGGMVPQLVQSLNGASLSNGRVSSVGDDYRPVSAWVRAEEPDTLWSIDSVNPSKLCKSRKPVDAPRSCETFGTEPIWLTSDRSGFMVSGRTELTFGDLDSGNRITVPIAIPLDDASLVHLDSQRAIVSSGSNNYLIKFGA